MICSGRYKIEFVSDLSLKNKCPQFIYVSGKQNLNLALIKLSKDVHFSNKVYVFNRCEEFLDCEQIESFAAMIKNCYKMKMIVLYQNKKTNNFIRFPISYNQCVSKWYKARNIDLNTNFAVILLPLSKKSNALKYEQKIKKMVNSTNWSK